MAASTAKIIRPILIATYGKGDMVQSLADHLVAKIDGYEPVDDRDSRERMVTLECWNWMPGGTTAASVARRIEEALR